MSEFFAEATVRLTPDLTGFVTQLKTEVKAAVERVEGTPAAKVKIAPALTRDFVGELRRQVNAAVAQAQRGVRPVQIRAVLSDVSRRQIARELQSRTQTVGGVPTRPQRTGTPAPGAAAAPIQQSAAAQRLLNSAMAQGIPILNQTAAATTKVTQATTKQAGARAQNTKSIVQAVPAATKLAAAQIALVAAQAAPAGSQVQTQQTRVAANALAVAGALAQQATSQTLANQAVLQAIPGLQGQVTALQNANAAIAANQKALAQQAAAAQRLAQQQASAASRAARSQEQLRRGALSTSLSFLGIRGATLAASASFLAGAAAIAVFAKALQSATQFAVQMNVFRATTQATGVEMERVAAHARQLGADITLPGVSAADAGEAMVELSKAGLSVQDSMDGARGVLQLATAAAITNAQAVELAANAINAFALAGRDATHVADVFANAANAAQGSIVDIGIAFQQASAAGRQVGLSFEDTSTFLTILARNGLRGSDAGTSLRTALIRLIKPTKDAKEQLKELGVELRDASGNLRPDVFLQITEATKGMSAAQRDSIIALVGGQDAFRAISILGRGSMDQFIRLRKELRQQGTAAELAAARATGLKGAIDALSNTLSTAGLRVGKSFTPAIQGIVEGLTGAVAGLAASDQAAQVFGGGVEFLNIGLSALGETLQGIAAVALPVAGALASIATAIGIPTILTAVAVFKLWPIIMARAATATTAFAASAGRAAFVLKLLRDPAITGKFAALASSFNLATIAVTALAAGIFFLVTRESEAERQARRLKEATDELITSQENLNTAIAGEKAAPRDVNRARRELLDAERTEREARTRLRDSDAGGKSFERRRLHFDLRIATDDVAVAQERLNEALRRSRQVGIVAAEAIIRRRKAIREEIRALQDLAHVQRDPRRGGTRGPTVEGPGAVGGRRAAVAQEAAVTANFVKENLKRAEALKETGDAESILLAQRLEFMARLTKAIGQVPTSQTIDMVIKAPNLQEAANELKAGFIKAGDTASAAMVESILIGLGILPIRLKRYVDGPFRATGKALFANAGGEHGEAYALSWLDMVKRLLGQQAGLEIQEAMAIIASPATGATLPAKQAQLANAQERERRVRAEIAASIAKGGPGETPSLRKQLRDAINDQAQIIGEIRGVNDQLASEAEQAKNDAKEKQDKIFSDILEAMGVKRDARQNAIEDAQITESLADDLAATRRLRRLAAQQIASLVARITSARAQGKNVAVLIEGLKVLKDLWRDLGREVIETNRARQEQLREQIAEGNQLDIEFAEMTDNRQLEIRARLREIARLKKLQNATKAGTVEYKRYRNLIEEQRQAIQDITNETKKLFAEMAFNFLTTQQGFAANLLGNLLPLGAIGGTVSSKMGARAGAGGAGGASAQGLGGSLGATLGGGLGAGGGGGGALGIEVDVPGANIPRGAGGAGGAAVPGGPFTGATGAGGRDGVRGAAAATQAGAIATPTRGQAATTNDLLRQILRAIRHQLEKEKHPSSKKQQKHAGGSLDVQ